MKRASGSDANLLKSLGTKNCWANYVLLMSIKYETLLQMKLKSDIIDALWNVCSYKSEIVK